MANEQKTLYLIDGMSLIYRGHFGMIRNPRLTSAGMNTSALLVFTRTLLSILEKGTHVAVALDTPEPTHRHEVFNAYKSHREEMPEDLKNTIPYVIRLCEALNVAILELPGWEADDIIGTFAKQAEQQGYITYMVTPDKDYAQLVSENIYMCKPSRNDSGMEVLGVSEILAQWQVERIDQVVDVLGLMGDTSDNVPGVPSIGEKTAKKLIAEYGTVENLLKSLSTVRGKRRKVLEENHEQALLSKDLVTIRLDVPLNIDVDELQCKEWERDSLKTLFQEVEFLTLGKRIFGDEFVESKPAHHLQTIETTNHQYKIVATTYDRKILINRLARRKSFCFDLETTHTDSKKGELVGLAFSYAPHSGSFVPCTDDTRQTRQILEEFRPILEDRSIEKIGYNLKFDLNVLRWKGIMVKGRLFDTMIAASLTNPNMRCTVQDLSMELLDYETIKITSLISENCGRKLTLRDVPLQQVADYASENADITFQLSEILRPKLHDMNQEKVFYEIECPLIPALVEMEYEGIRLDVGVLRKLANRLDFHITNAAERVYELADKRFSLSSARQLGEILFDKLELDSKAQRTAKTGQYKTDEKILRRLASKHEIVEQVLQYRSCTRLRSVYVSQFSDSVDERSERVHTRYEQTSTVNGRLESSMSNLQNILIRTDTDWRIREVFRSRNDGYLLLSANYLQIELRILAELCEDEKLLKTFLEGGDVHTDTATRIYGIDKSGVTDKIRRQAKAVNFGIICGVSASALSKRLDIPRALASDLIKQYLAQYPGVQSYIDRTLEFTRQHGYIETVTGRRCYIKDINSRNATIRCQAERSAMNAPIQGSAADLIKIAMGAIHAGLLEKEYRSRMLLQIHDELVFDLHRDELDEVPIQIETIMKKAIPMSVPIEVELGTGTNWSQAH